MVAVSLHGGVLIMGGAQTLVMCGGYALVGGFGVRGHELVVLVWPQNGRPRQWSLSDHICSFLACSGHVPEREARAMWPWHGHVAFAGHVVAISEVAMSWLAPHLANSWPRIFLQ